MRSLPKHGAIRLFKERLLKNTKAVLQEEGIDIPADVEFRAVENTDTLVYFIIPARPPVVTRGNPWP